MTELVCAIIAAVVAVFVAVAGSYIGLRGGTWEEFWTGKLIGKEAVKKLTPLFILGAVWMGGLVFSIIYPILRGVFYGEAFISEIPVIICFCNMGLAVVYAVIYYSIKGWPKNIISEEEPGSINNNTFFLRWFSKPIARFDWVKKSKPSKSKGHFALNKSYIKLYKNGLALFMYVYTTDGKYYIWKCNYKIQDGKLLLAPYFYGEGKCEVYEMNQKGLKYLGEWEEGSRVPPKRDLPYSLYAYYERSGKFPMETNFPTQTERPKGKIPKAEPHDVKQVCIHCGGELRDNQCLDCGMEQ
jgi:hypothetical protein